MTDLLIKVAINAVGVYVAIQLIPQLIFDFGDDWWKLGAVALILALVNSYLKPIVQLLAFPITIMTLGAVAFVINAAMLLVTAFVSDLFSLGFRIDTFPPDFTADVIVGAFLGSIVISLVSTALSLLNLGRKIIT